MYGEALHIAQAEAPTILEYYEAVATALNKIPAAATDKPYVVELDPEEEVRTIKLYIPLLLSQAFQAPDSFHRP